MQKLSSILGLPQDYSLPKPTECTDDAHTKYNTCTTSGGCNSNETPGGYFQSTFTMPGGYKDNKYYAFRFGPIPNKLREPTTRPSHPDYKGPKKYEGMRKDGVTIVTPPEVTQDVQSKDHMTEDYTYRWRNIFGKEAYPDNKWTVEWIATIS